MGLLLLACLAVADVRSAKCDVACRWAGFDRGYYEGDRCACVEIRDFAQMTGEKRLNLNAKRIKRDD